MHIAVFGDLHGNILLVFQSCARWQQETGQQLDLILQVGDLGVFPDPTRLDRATRRHSKSDRTVLGFLEYFTTSHAEVAAVLGETTCPLLFVRGNHEDHAWLDNQERRVTAPIFPVDAYQRLWCLKTGIPYTFQQGSEQITILGIGRIGRPASSQREKTHYIQPSEQQRLEQLDETHLDLLLTHDAPRDAIYLGSGSYEITRVLWHQKPSYHFFGHYGGPAQFFPEANGETKSYKLADLAGRSQGDEQALEIGAIGLLCWRNRSEHTFDLLEPVMHFKRQ